MIARSRPPFDICRTVTCTLLAVGAPAAAFAQTSFDIEDYHQKLQKIHATTRVKGVSNCMSCHSGKNATGNKKNSKSGIAGDLWRGSDFDGAHYAAYKTLFDEQSKIMGKVLASVDASEPDPTKRDDCLSCHAFGHDIPLNMRQASFQLDDGVSCEACHGRSEHWQSPHEFDDWHTKSPQEWLDKGMYDTRDLRRWAEKCLECHLGTKDKRVTHTMMGAGHPALTLELAGDIFDVPKHWDSSRTYLSEDEGPWYYARLWAVGQAVSLRESMSQLRAWAANPQGPPDFAFFDCYSCHHEYLKTPSRMPGRGLTAGAKKQPLRLTTPGQPPWNGTAWVLSRHLVDIFAPNDRDTFNQAIDTIFRSFLIHDPKPAAVAKAATDIERIADQVAANVVGTKFNRQTVRTILRAMAADPEPVIAVGPYGAEQAYGALNALYYLAWGATTDKPENDPEIMDTIKRLRPLVYDDAGALSLRTFDPAAYRKLMADLTSELAKTN